MTGSLFPLLPLKPAVTQQALSGSTKISLFRILEERVSYHLRKKREQDEYDTVFTLLCMSHFSLTQQKVDKVRAIFCVAGGWAGGNAADVKMVCSFPSHSPNLAHKLFLL